MPPGAHGVRRFGGSRSLAVRRLGRSLVHLAAVVARAARAPDRRGRRPAGGPTRSRARAPRGRASLAWVIRASVASSRRQLDGLRPDCASARTASAPRGEGLERHAGRDALCSGRSCTRTQASVITPRIPSEPDQHPVRARARAGARQPPALPGAARGERADRLDQVVDVGPDGREVAAGAGRDPAAEGRVLERLREVAQGEPVLAELLVERRAEHAGLDPRRARDRIDLEHPVERAEVDAHRAGVGTPRPAARSRRRRWCRRRRGSRPLPHRRTTRAPPPPRPRRVGGRRGRAGCRSGRESRGRRRGRPCRARG